MLGFILSVIAVYLFYYVLHIRKYNKDGSYKKKGKAEPKMPAEVELLIRANRLDISKINYRALLKYIGLVCAVDVAVIVSIVMYLPIDNLSIKVLVGGALAIPVIWLSYRLMGRYFKKKGLVRTSDRNK